MVEVAARNWGAVFVSDVIKAAPVYAGLTYSAFALAMAVGRFVGDRLVDRFGPVLVARTSCVIAFAGLTLVVLAGSPIEVVVGFAAAGLGVATGFPLSATAAAGRGDLPPAVNVAALQVVGVGAFLLTPPLIGGVAELDGLRLGIAVVLPMIVVSFVLARELTRQGGSGGGNRGEGMMVHAIRVEEVGGPEVMKWAEVTVGEPGPGEVRLRHLAVGVNFIDVYYRKGVYPPPGGYPLIPGAEGAGEIEAIGEGVTGLKPGDRVAYQVQVGAYAEKRLIKADRVVKTARRARSEGRGGRLPQGTDRAVPDPPHLQGREGPDDPVARGGGRRRLDRDAVAVGARGDRDRHGRRRQQDRPRQGQWLRPRDQLPDRGFRRPGQGDHRRRGGGLRLRLGRQGHLPGLARLPQADRDVRVVRAVLGPAAAVHAGDAPAEGIALRDPADGRPCTSPGVRTSRRRRPSCSRRSGTGR